MPKAQEAFFETLHALSRAVSPAAARPRFENRGYPRCHFLHWEAKLVVNAWRREKATDHSAGLSVPDDDLAGESGGSDQSLVRVDREKVVFVTGMRSQRGDFVDIELCGGSRDCEFFHVTTCRRCKQILAPSVKSKNGLRKVVADQVDGILFGKTCFHIGGGAIFIADRDRIPTVEVMSFSSGPNTTRAGFRLYSKDAMQAGEWSVFATVAFVGCEQSAIRPRKHLHGAIPRR